MFLTLSFIIPMVTHVMIGIVVLHRCDGCKTYTWTQMVGQTLDTVLLLVETVTSTKGEDSMSRAHIRRVITASDMVFVSLVHFVLCCLDLTWKMLTCNLLTNV
eukprot:Lithocolla_globosa_v1_NODE_7471_length_942_cov_21.988726.p3 type:complete len:103 gc:universal NODE_7471_length_942_cov_21.988726:412-720(+)